MYSIDCDRLWLVAIINIVNGCDGDIWFRWFILKNWLRTARTPPNTILHLAPSALCTARRSMRNCTQYILFPEGIRAAGYILGQGWRWNGVGAQSLATRRLNASIDLISLSLPSRSLSLSFALLSIVLKLDTQSNGKAKSGKPMEKDYLP